jgi:hypothetical protein
VSAQVIAALRKRADVLEEDAALFHHDRDVAWKYVQTVGGASMVTPNLLKFVAAQFRALADEAEGCEPQDEEIEP